jgi:hypothetical protein
MRVQRLTRGAQFFRALGRLGREKLKTEWNLECVGHKNLTRLKEKNYRTQSTQRFRRRRKNNKLNFLFRDFCETLAPSAS